jgi:DNA-binding transcriptional ArsR family regulator
VLRIHFTAEDLMRVKFADAPAPLMELGLALSVLSRHVVDPVFVRWQRTTAHSLPTNARPLLELLPPSGLGPLFLDPISEGLDDGLDTVLGTPTPFLHSELHRITDNGQPITPWLRLLSERDREAWQLLETAIRAAYGKVVDAPWDRLRAAFHAEVAWRASLWSRRGIAECLASLVPGSSWRGAVWEIERRESHDVHLSGEGLTLLPSVFWTAGPLVGSHPDGTALLVYPGLTPLPLIDEPRASDPLGNLLGRTRASVLEALAEERTTGELARTLGISLASASEHTRTLREAGLVSTLRSGKEAWHCCTALGAQLLRAPRGPDSAAIIPGRSASVLRGEPTGTGPSSDRRAR